MPEQKKSMYHTTLLIICKDGFGENTVLDLLESPNFTALIRGELQVRFGDIIYVTIYPRLGQERGFGKNKEDFIKNVYIISKYLSIVYDSQTALYMKRVSQSVYHLEREFRALIEMVFLRKYGVKWYENNFKDSSREHDRSRSRSQVMQYINNPLDNRNFVDLKSFVEAEINFSKNAMAENLNKINELIVKQSISDQGAQKVYGEVLDLLKGIKELSEFKASKVYGADIYNHITPEISKEWETLYFSHRNLWAHNYCLMTQAELAEYETLSESVLRKIRTEITLLSLMEKEEVFAFPQSSNELISLSISKLIRSGAPICRLKLQIDIETKRYLLEITEATYTDLFEILEVLALLANLEEQDKHLKFIGSNPFLINKVQEIGEEILNSPILHKKLKEDFAEIKEAFQSKNKLFSFRELDGALAIVNSDLDNFLKIIHKKQEQGDI
ncbi:TPA: hypothetical protein ACGSMF_004024 [Bacillus cereus]